LDESAEQRPLERFCALLADHGVEFDVDLCYRRTSDNLERLATALATLDSPRAGHHPT